MKPAETRSACRGFDKEQPPPCAPCPNGGLRSNPPPTQPSYIAPRHPRTLRPSESTPTPPPRSPTSLPRPPPSHLTTAPNPFSATTHPKVWPPTPLPQPARQRTRLFRDRRPRRVSNRSLLNNEGHAGDLHASARRGAVCPVGSTWAKQDQHRPRHRFFARRDGLARDHVELSPRSMYHRPTPKSCVTCRARRTGPHLPRRERMCAATRAF